MSVLYLILLVPLFWLLGKSANLTTRAIIDIAKLWGLSDLTIGFVILGLATSAPELLVGINSALKGIPGLSYGNLIGANIVLLSFVVGLSAILNGKIHLHDRIEQRTIYTSTIIILFPLLLALDGIVSRADGLILIAIYLVYLSIVIIKRRKIETEITRPFIRHDVHAHKLWLWFAAGIIGLLIGSRFVVFLAGNLSENWHIAPVVVGFLILSFGTNLPEIFITVKNRNTEHNHVAFGNVIGSAVVNTLLLGIVALISPIVIGDSKLLFTGIAFLIIIAALFNIFLKTKATLSRNEGVALIVIYILFIITQGILK
ncbi:sodium:calcium antiporter [Patescibacteria group bacterium]|nr:MAG: sodium:calcium antiporter [Patescibacteria group bacterium]